MNALDLRTCNSRYQDIIQYLKARDYIKSEELVKTMLLEQLDSPEPHNLIGIIFEFRNEFERARAHYRAALALDPSYLPAARNLDRISRIYYCRENIDYGEAIRF